MDDILFPIDSDGLDSFNNSDNECDEDANDEIEINSGNMNLLANAPDTNNTTLMPNKLPLTYYQKLEAK